MVINSTWDIAVTRNPCRKFVRSQNFPISICARVVAVIAIFGEFILQSNGPRSLEIKIASQR